jgi:hypothetical protein
MSATGGRAGDRRREMQAAYEAVRAARPDSDAQAAELFRRELRQRGIIGVPEEVIAEVAPLFRMPRWLAGLRATRMTFGMFGGLARAFLAKAEPKWLSPPGPPSYLHPGRSQTMRGTTVILDQSAQPTLDRIAAERPRSDDRSITFLVTLISDGTTAVAVPIYWRM